MDSDDELLDLVDKNDNKIGTILRSQKPNLGKQNRGFLRASEILIYNKASKLWISRRSLNKRIAPGGLDFSASGHVAAGETYLEAVVRETKEELNLDIDPKSVKLLHKFPPTGDESIFFRSVYIYKTDKVPRYNPQDFTGYEWLSPKELLERLDGGEPAKRSLRETIVHLLKHPL